MLGIKVSIPVACFRKGLAREYLETYELPPPSTCYGFLLALVGETNRETHLGARVTAALLEKAEMSVVLRTVWRLKKTPLGSPGNIRPDYQQLLTDVKVIIWLDSSQETPLDNKETLEQRVRAALDPSQRGKIERFGGLSLGESAHLVNDVLLVNQDEITADSNEGACIFLADVNGQTTLPVWVDHVGSEKTRYAVGTIVPDCIVPRNTESIPLIHS